MGIKAIPTRIKELRGNPGKRPLNTREPVPPEIMRGTPDELTGDPTAIKEWQRLAPMLSAIKQITEADRSALIALCLNWSRFLIARKNAARENYQSPGPRGGYSHWFAVETKALAVCLKLWPELGLTPSSRSKVHIAETPTPGGDPFSEFDHTPPPAATILEPDDSGMAH